MSKPLLIPFIIVAFLFCSMTGHCEEATSEANSTEANSTEANSTEANSTEANFRKSLTSIPIQSLEIFPASFELKGRRAEQQLVTTGTASSKNVYDVTHQVQYTSSDKKVVRIESGRVIATGNGNAEITATYPGNLTATSQVRVTLFDQPMPVSFHLETLAALTKAGCNSGACHGSPSGKGGFRLSLRAYDSALDVVTLRTGSIWSQSQSSAT